MYSRSRCPRSPARPEPESGRSSKASRRAGRLTCVALVRALARLGVWLSGTRESLGVAPKCRVKVFLAEGIARQMAGGEAGAPRGCAAIYKLAGQRLWEDCAGFFRWAKGQVFPAADRRDSAMRSRSRRIRRMACAL